MKAARTLAFVLALGIMELAVGCSGSKPDTNIEDSVNTSLAEFPSMAAIEVFPTGPDGWTFFCSGVVLDEKHVLTTLHCVKMDNTVYRVLVGLDNLSQVNKVLTYEIDTLLTFPTIKDMADIAILRLDKRIRDFGELIRPVEIADYDINDNTHPTWTLSAVGWGRSWYLEDRSVTTMIDKSKIGRHLSSELRKVDVEFGSTSKCLEMFDPAHFDSEIICTTDRRGNYMRKLDLGGPLFHGLDKERRLVGLPHKPSANPFVFVDVTRFKSLIEGCIGSEARCKAVKSTLPQSLSTTSVAAQFERTTS